MTTKVIGLDVGTSAVRAAQMSLGASPVLLRFGQVALPPGAMRDGEVVDAEAVATALRRLWQELGFKDKRVHLGIASRRVLVRAVELPGMAEGDTRSALGLQLGDYVPFPAEDTVFDFSPLSVAPDAHPALPGAAGPSPGNAGAPTDDDHPAPSPGMAAPGSPGMGTEEEGHQRVLLGAAHRDPVDALLDAVRRAGLRPVSLEPLPCALARVFAGAVSPLPALAPPPVLAAFASPPSAPPEMSVNGGPSLPSSSTAVDPSPAGAPPLLSSQLIVSVGAGTVMVVGTMGEQAVFSRTITNLAGAAMTERLATALGVGGQEAEVAKRCAAVGDHPDLPFGTLSTMSGLVDELVEEIGRSVGFYLSQVGAVAPQRVVLTGAGLSLPDLSNRLAVLLDVPVVTSDLLATLPTRDLGFEPEMLAALAPVTPAPIGLALGAGARRATKGRIDLLSGLTVAAAPKRKRLKIAGGGLAALVLIGAYVQQGRSLGSEQASVDELRAQAAAVATAAAPTATPEAARAVGAQAVVATAATTDLDWLAVLRRLDTLSTSLGVQLGSRQASAAAAPTGATAAGAAAVAASNVAAATTTTAAVRAGPMVHVAGDVQFEATAPDIGAVAAWLDAVGEDEWFTDAWVGSVIPGATGVSFVGHVSLTDAARSTRLEALMEVAP